MTPPTLYTERLVLRPATMADFAAYAAFLTTDRTRYMSGPLGIAKAWDWFCNDVAQWPLLAMGALIVAHQGRVVGQVAVCQGPNFPEPELGWFLYDAADEGHGFVTEAATALRDWAFGPRGLATLVSYIDPDNHRSIAMATRLGATLDPKAADPGDEPTLVYRYPRAA